MLNRTYSWVVLLLINNNRHGNYLSCPPASPGRSKSTVNNTDSSENRAALCSILRGIHPHSATARPLTTLLLWWKSSHRPDGFDSDRRGFDASADGCRNATSPFGSRWLRRVWEPGSCKWHNSRHPWCHITA